jgi:A/G-specific adenine glycosylase
MAVDSHDIAPLRRKLLYWFRNNGRTYPWRETSDPWKILMAEMMLRRTKADQVEKVYRQFISQYRTPGGLLRGSPNKIRRILSPLGLNWRQQNFFDLAEVLIRDFKSTVPSTREELKQLPGVGDYVAGAVLSIGFGKREWIVDSNVVRVFKRFFNLHTSKEARRDRSVIELAKAYAQTSRPREANLAILDFSSAICLPGTPRCNICPLRRVCQSFIDYRTQ